MIAAILICAVLFAMFALVKPRAGCSDGCSGDGRCGTETCDKVERERRARMKDTA